MSEPLAVRDTDALVAMALGLAFKPNRAPGAREPFVVINGILAEIPWYSTSIADAWACIEHLRGMGWEACVTAEDTDYMCEFWRNNDHEGARGYTPALAICHAFLNVMDVAG